MKYRYHWSFKLLALVLAVISGAVMILGAAGLVLDDLGFYENVRQGQLHREVWEFSSQAAEAVFDNFAWKNTGIEPKLFERFFRWGADVDAVESLEHDFFYTIRDERNGQMLDGNYVGGDWAWCDGYQFDVRRGYVTEMPKAEYYPTFDQIKGQPGELAYIDLAGNALPALGDGVTDIEYYVVSEDDSVNWQNISTECYNHADAGGAEYTIYRMEYTGYESYRVEICMTEEQMDAIKVGSPEEEFIPRLLAKHHDLLAPLAIWGGICLLLSILWLALVAGGSPKREEIKPGGLNMIPLDIWLAALAVAGFALAALAIESLEYLVRSSGWGNYDGSGGMETFILDAGLLGFCGGAGGGILALFFMALAAQLKVGDGYWLKHTAVGICWRYGWKYGKQAVLWCWSFGRRSCARVAGVCRRFVRMLPLTWQWLIAGFAILLLMFLCIFNSINRYSPMSLILGCIIPALVVIYGAYCFGALRDTAQKMSQGKLEEKVENKYLLGCFGEFAEHLNALGDTCIEAAKQQMKSERMKSELITNVSHDIKTPLTSIINYVDLLQRTGDEDERREYLEVLDRQSQRLKKLIEDLMEMSRANSGNVAVEITPTDVCEAVNQALGEFSDNLERCGLTVMAKVPQEPCMALCDGRHLWRVLSNCLSNVVKYAMPGTRVYVDVLKRGQKVEVSIKNISAQMLNITAGELMERFVRGDASRNTEGNGLGLNIAKSLMELQGGRLELSVDGDLFKVVLTLNGA